jgi:hypothetical protein
MPLKSRAERAFLAINKPGLSKQFEAETPKGAKLPEYVAGSKYAGKAKSKTGLGKWI